jgi:hypothetical protein
LRCNCLRGLALASLALAVFLSPTAADAQPPSATGGTTGIALPPGAVHGRAGKNSDQAGARAIEILSALYGRSHTKQSCDAAEAVRERCQGKLRCRVRVDGSLCGPPQTPPRLLIPSLVVIYQCSPSGLLHDVRGDSPFAVLISCSGPEDRSIPGSDN